MNSIQKYLTLILLVMSVFHTQAQLPAKAEKLVGKWEYKKGSGSENFTLHGDTLKGVAALIDKYGHELPVERMQIKIVNGHFIYTAQKISADSLGSTQEHLFVAKGKRLKFYNTEDEFVQALKYRVRCFSANKMVLIIYTSEGDKRKLRLNKVD